MTVSFVPLRMPPVGFSVQSSDNTLLLVSHDGQMPLREALESLKASIQEALDGFR